MHLLGVHVAIHKLLYEVLETRLALLAVKGIIASLKFAPANDSGIRVCVCLELYLAYFSSFVAGGQQFLFNLLLTVHRVVDPAFEAAMLGLTTLLVGVVPAMDVSETLLAFLLSVLSNAFCHL